MGGVGAAPAALSVDQEPKVAWFWCVRMPLFCAPPVCFAAFAAVAEHGLIADDGWRPSDEVDARP